MSVKLKPCPFCGGHAIIDGCDDGQWIVICKECATSSGYNETKQEAIDAWNWRIEPTFTLDELDAIRRNVRGNCVLLVRELSTIEQRIIDKCDDTLKGRSVE